MKYVGRWDNGSGYMEWAGRPVDSIKNAMAQVKEETGISVDVIEVNPEAPGREDAEVNPEAHGREDAEGSTVAFRAAGHEWVVNPL